MIIKSLIIASIIFDFFGFSSFSARLDQAIIRKEFNPQKSAIANADLPTLPEILPRPSVKHSAPSTAILARQYLLADANSGKILLKEEIKKRVPIASTTKIMTAVVALENYNLDDVVVISTAAANQAGAEINLRIGEKITVSSLLNALLISSGNDAAYALAELMNNENESGISKFVKAMNDKASALGLNDTEYHDPAGLDTSGWSSAYDLFLVTKYALTKKEFARIVRVEQTTVYSADGLVPHPLKTSNRLIGEYRYLGAIGIKTGFMPEAGHVLVSAAEREGHTLIGVVINTFADTPSASADESRKLLDWGFNNIEW